MTSSDWVAYFHSNVWSLPESLWRDSYQLSREERNVIASALQQFQLGEGSDGAGLIHRAARFARNAADPAFVDSTRAFIAEERRHSDYLGRFMDRQGISRIGRHWLDGVFRGLRRLAGLDMIVTVLVTAEIVAVPFYRALRAATRSRLLHEICDRILTDESAHLVYQGQIIARIRRHRSAGIGRVARALHGVLVAGTVVLVYGQYRRVFSAACYSFTRVALESLQEFECVYRFARPPASPHRAATCGESARIADTVS